MTSLADYWRMFRARGFGRVWHHAIEVSFFDLVHGTDTDTWLPLKAYQTSLANQDLAIAYQPSFSSEVIKSLNFVALALGNRIAACDFYDLGSGKGKVCFIARRYRFASINGIEFYPPLCLIAKNNALRFADSRITFHCADVTQFEFPKGCLVFFAYNPFQIEIWRQLLTVVADRPYVVIYNNPIHREIFNDQYVWFEDIKSRWENKRTVVFANFKRPLGATQVV